MLLHHTTSRQAVKDIAREGLKDGPDGFVFLSKDVWSSSQDWMLPVSEIARIGADELVMLFDIPEEVAGQFLGGAGPIQPDDPEFDPELDSVDGNEPLQDGQYWSEWHIPAETANRYFAGLAFWHGECPVSADQLRDMWSRVER